MAKNECVIPSMPQRRFLFLQGPHGPFFRHLARRLRDAGATCHRIGFNAGDELFWKSSEGYIAFKERPDQWAGFLRRQLQDLNVTDLVVYGEVRKIHQEALSLCRKQGVRTHIFEEGYLRPYWITYERDGSNGNSPLCRIPLSAMRSELDSRDAPESAVGWGELREHIFYGAVYHAALMAGRRSYPNYRGHRDISVRRETLLNIGRFLSLPWHTLERRIATARIRLRGSPYHLAILQLEHDASFRGHAHFSTMGEFVDLVVREFASGAKPHHHLIFKAHPLEDGRARIKRAVRLSAKEYGLEHRVHFIRGGKLAGLLDDALSAVTINSTAGQQVLRRGMPLKALGEAVYSGRGFTSNQPLAKFFEHPDRPDREAYDIFRRYQLETCQVVGGFYAATGRARLLRRIVDIMLDAHGPYARRKVATEPHSALRLAAK